MSVSTHPPLPSVEPAVPPPSPTASVKVPRATYRAQFNEGFRLPDALALVPYWHGLGISHIYSSPLLKALPRSSHGYDVCDFNQLNPELGTEADLAALADALHERGMGLVLDIVPNHMGIGGPDNRWWWDVLARGPASPFANYFEIDWQSPDPRVRGKVLAPILGERYQHALAAGKWQLHFQGGAFTLRYAEHQFPVAPRSLASLLGRAAELYRSEALSQLAQFGDDYSAFERQVDRLCRELPAVAQAITQSVAELNANPDALDALTLQQSYRPTCWRNSDTDLNYRRFFNIASLASLRTEEPRVFADVHQRVLHWHGQGWVDGFRIDHIDGLRDPEEYLERLRALAPRAWIVVEKIVEPGESLPRSWPVSGTTGYDFLNRAGGLFIDPASETALTEFYAEFTGEPTDYEALVLEKNRLVLRDLLAPEVNRLVALLEQIAAQHWRVRDFSVGELRAGVVEVVACLPVYRTYARPHVGRISPADEAIISETMARARRQRPDLNSDLFDFLGDVLLLRLRGDLESELVMRIQQVTGPAMAKGVEDTALYCFNRLIALNEVGADPSRFGISVEEFHQACRNAQALWPDAMLATSTHDSKFSEDARARMSLISEIPNRWREAVRRWSGMNERHHQDQSPGRNIEYRFYQTLLGVWPLELDRALGHFDKVACEAKTRTTWTQRNEPYDESLRVFITRVLQDSEFKADFEQFARPLIQAGHVNSLAQTLLKLTAPGVPDFYQGCELWSFNLVDPDNRRPVDFASRQRLLSELDALSPEEVWRRHDEGLPKMWLIRRVLTLRARRADLFGDSNHCEPLTARGAQADHAVAFHRGNAVTVVPRLVLGLNGDWADTVLELPAGQWRNELDGKRTLQGAVTLVALTSQFPVAFLTRE